MVQLLTIIAFIAMHTRDAVWTAGAPGASGEGVAVWSGPVWHVSHAFTALLVGGALGLCVLAGHVACTIAGRKIDRTGSILSVGVAERSLLAVRVAGTGVFVASLYVVDWLGVVRSWMGDVILIDEIVCLSPLIAVFLLSWASAYPIERRLREATILRRLDSGQPLHDGPTRAQSVLAHARQSLAIVGVPILMITGWHELVAHLRTRTSLESTAEWWTLGALDTVGTLAVFVLSPAVLKAVWATSPLGAGELRDMLLRVAQKFKVKLREPLVWHTHTSIMNGAVLGLVWPFRYLLFTDLLLERLLPRQVEAVAAHEFGHIRHHHIFWLAISGLGAVLFVDTILELIAGWMDLRETFFLDSLLVGVPLIAGVFVFGWVSRRFEWQADAFAVKHLSEEIGVVDPGSGESVPGTRVGGIVPAAAMWMESSLREVARMNGVDPSRFMFRHGSIDDRIRRLRQLIGLSPQLLPIDRTVRWVKAWSLVVFVASIAGMILGTFVPDGR